MMEFLFIIFIVIISVHGSAVITDKSICGVYQLPGTPVTLNCTADNSGLGITDAIPGDNTLRWRSPGLFSLTVTNDTTPLSDTTGSYTATVTSSNIINGGETFVNSTLSFTATQMNDGITIFCRNAQVGSSEDICTILVYTVPSVTTALTNTSVTYNSVTLSWTPPTDTGGYPTVNYIIEVANDRNISTGEGVTSYTVDGLVCHQTYIFTVRANNSIGQQGNPSNTVTVRIPCEDPPQPSNINICLDIRGYSFLISWNNCPPVISNIDTTPPVTNYSLLVDMLFDNRVTTINVTTHGLVCNYSVNAKYTLYSTNFTVNITANSIAGSSQLLSDAIYQNEIKLCYHIQLYIYEYLNNKSTSTPASTPPPTSTPPPIGLYAGVGAGTAILLVILAVVIVIIVVAVLVVVVMKRRTKESKEGKNPSSPSPPLVHDNVACGDVPVIGTAHNAANAPSPINVPAYEAIS